MTRPGIENPPIWTDPTPVFSTLTSGSTYRRISSPLTTWGLKFSRTPNSLNSTDDRLGHEQAARRNDPVRQSPQSVKSRFRIPTSDTEKKIEKSTTDTKVIFWMPQLHQRSMGFSGAWCSFRRNPAHPADRSRS